MGVVGAENTDKLMAEHTALQQCRRKTTGLPRGSKVRKAGRMGFAALPHQLQILQSQRRSSSPRAWPSMQTVCMGGPPRRAATLRRRSGTQPALPPNAARRIRPHFYPKCLNSSTKLQYHLPANSPFHLHSAEVRWNFLTPDPGQNFTTGRAGLPSCSVMFSVAQSSPCLLVLRSRQAGS